MAIFDILIISGQDWSADFGGCLVDNMEETALSGRVATGLGSGSPSCSGTAQWGVDAQSLQILQSTPRQASGKHRKDGPKAIVPEHGPQQGLNLLHLNSVSHCMVHQSSSRMASKAPKRVVELFTIL